MPANPCISTKIQALEDRLNRVCERLPQGHDALTADRRTPKAFDDASPPARWPSAPDESRPLATDSTELARRLQQLAAESRGSHKDLHCFDQASAQQLQYDLDHFRQRLAYFPFLHLPDDITAQQLADTSPLLMGAIHHVTFEAPGSEKMKSSNAYMHLLSSLALSRKADALDLAQAYLVWLAWYHQNFHGIRILGVCISYCDGIVTGALLEDEQVIKYDRNSEHECMSRTSAIRRVFMGIAYMRACLQMFGNDRLNGSTDWDELEDMATSLVAGRETANDESLPHLVRLCRRVSELAVLGKRAGKRRQGSDADDASAIAAIAEKLYAHPISDDLAASYPLLPQLCDFLQISILSTTIRATPYSAQREATLVHPLIYRTCQQIDNALLHAFSRGSAGLQQLTVVTWAQMVGVVNLFDRLAWHTPDMPSSTEGYTVKQLLLARLDSLSSLCESARQHGPGIDPQDHNAINWLALVCHNLKARQEEDKQPDPSSDQTGLVAISAAAHYVPKKVPAHASQLAWQVSHPNNDPPGSLEHAAPPDLPSFSMSQPDDVSFLDGPDLFDWSNVFSLGTFNFPEFGDFSMQS